MIPIHLAQPGVPRPDGTYFLVAKNGVFLHKDGGVVRGTVRVALDDLDLEDVATEVNLDLPPLPARHMFRAYMFFQRVWSRHRAEAAVVLFFNTATQEYYVHCPKQEVSGGGVQYGIDDQAEVRFATDMRKKGYRRVGTIHSHCDFSAYHSGVDTADEAKFDGLHITIGHVNKASFSVAASLVINDNRRQVGPHTVIDGLATEAKSEGWWNPSITTYYSFAMNLEEVKALYEEVKDELEEWVVANVRTWQHRPKAKLKLKLKDDTHWEKLVSDENDPTVVRTLPADPAARRVYLTKVRKTAKIILKRGRRIRPVLLRQLVQTIQDFCQKPKIDKNDLQFCATIDPNNFNETTV